VTYQAGDVVALGASIAPADLVALDRVVCCYPDMAALVGLAADRARQRVGFVYPRDSWWIRAGAGTMNAIMQLLRRKLRFWVHRTAEVEAVIAAAGLRPAYRRAGIFWQVAVFERA
jgi:magnesium-protoporphyrin O-methyltransferase